MSLFETLCAFGLILAVAVSIRNLWRQRHERSAPPPPAVLTGVAPTIEHYHEDANAVPRAHEQREIAPRG